MFYLELVAAFLQVGSHLLCESSVTNMKSEFPVRAPYLDVFLPEASEGNVIN